MKVLPNTSIQAVGIALDLLEQELKDSIKELRQIAANEARFGNYSRAETAITEAKSLEAMKHDNNNIKGLWATNYTLPHDNLPKPNNLKKELALTLNSSGMQATATRKSGGKLTLHSGSTIKRSAGSSLPPAIGRRIAEMVARGELRKKSDSAFELCVDCEFSSPSNAATFVVGYEANGPLLWKVRETGESFGLWGRRNRTPVDLSSI